MSAAASDFWSSKQALDKEIHQRLFKDFSERCEAFPIEKMSTEDIQGSTLYGTTKKDFYFSTGAHETFENIMRTLRYFPVNQVHLRMWRHLVDEVYRYINYDVIPSEPNQFVTELLTLERIMRGVQIFNLYGSQTDVDRTKASEILGLSPERLAIFIPRSYFKRGAQHQLTSQRGLSKDTVGHYLKQPYEYSFSDFDIGEGELFKPIFLYLLKTIAHRRDPKFLRIIREDTPISYTDFSRQSWGMESINKMVDFDKRLRHPFPAFDNILGRVISKEEYLDIYGL